MITNQDRLNYDSTGRSGDQLWDDHVETLHEGLDLVIGCEICYQAHAESIVEGNEVDCAKGAVFTKSSNAWGKVLRWVDGGCPLCKAVWV